MDMRRTLLRNSTKPRTNEPTNYKSIQIYKKDATDLALLVNITSQGVRYKRILNIE